ncbi:MAG: 50S ribosomal protein L30 [Exilispira sp.]
MKKISIELIKSPIGYKKEIRDTVKALGLKKMHQIVYKEENPAILGMIKKVSFLLKLENI